VFAVIFGAGPSNGLPLAIGPHVKNRLNAILQQTERLVAERHELKARVQRLDGELGDLRRSEEVLRARVAELERENGVLRKARSAEQGTAAAGTKERIDELVQEIDRCLALLTPAAQHN
jgi:chromosome segregation ATPase